MNNGIADHGEYWIYSGMDSEIGEHWFIELTILDQGKKLYIHVDFFDDEYTLSASEDSARVFFEEKSEKETELPCMIEIFGQVPTSKESRYVPEYRKAKDLLDKARGCVECKTVSEGMEALRSFLKKRRG